MVPRLSRSTITLLVLLVVAAASGVVLTTWRAELYGTLADVAGHPRSLFWVASLIPVAMFALISTELLPLRPLPRWVLRGAYLPLIAWSLATASQPAGSVRGDRLAEELDTTLSLVQREAVLHLRDAHAARLGLALVLVAVFWLCTRGVRRDPRWWPTHRRAVGFGAIVAVLATGTAATAWAARSAPDLVDLTGMLAEETGGETLACEQIDHDLSGCRRGLDLLVERPDGTLLPVRLVEFDSTTDAESSRATLATRADTDVVVVLDRAVLVVAAEAAPEDLTEIGRDLALWQLAEQRPHG